MPDPEMGKLPAALEFLCDPRSSLDPDAPQPSDEGD